MTGTEGAATLQNNGFVDLRGSRREAAELHERAARHLEMLLRRAWSSRERAAEAARERRLSLAAA